MSSIVPPCCGCFLGQLRSVDIMGQKPPQMALLCMRAHARFQVCLALYRHTWNTETSDSPSRFLKWVWRSAGKLSQGQRWVMELLADHWGVWCNAGKVCYCVIITLRDVKVGLFKCSHKESSLLCALACTSHFMDSRAPIARRVSAHTRCHMPGNMGEKKKKKTHCFSSLCILVQLRSQKSKGMLRVRYWKTGTNRVKSKIERIPVPFKLGLI